MKQTIFNNFYVRTNKKKLMPFFSISMIFHVLLMYMILTIPGKTIEAQNPHPGSDGITESNISSSKHSSKQIIRKHAKSPRKAQKKLPPAATLSMQAPPAHPQCDYMSESSPLSEQESRNLPVSLYLIGNTVSGSDFGPKLQLVIPENLFSLFQKIQKNYLPADLPTFHNLPSKKEFHTFYLTQTDLEVFQTMYVVYHTLKRVYIMIRSLLPFGRMVGSGMPGPSMDYPVKI